MRRFAIIICICLLLTACVSEEPSPSAVAPTSAPTESVADVPQVTETVPATQAPTEPAATEPEPVAQRITDGYTFLLDEKNVSAVLDDDNHKTDRSVKQEEQLSVRSEEPFAALYIQWSQVPGDYLLRWDGGNLPCGGNGFLHEYIRLPEDVKEVYFQFLDETPKRICDIQLYTSGTIPYGVQDWLPPCEQADILVIPTHSDDDVLFFGPLIVHYALEEQLEVQTAFMVDHRFYPERNHERLNGLWEMGVRHYPIVGHAPDTGEHDFGIALDYYAASNIPQWQVELIRRFQPLVVVGHDIKGEYGNGGHKVNTHFLMKAVEWAFDPEMYPESAEAYGIWNTPKLYLHCYPENNWMFEVNTPLKNDPWGRTAYEIAQEAFKCHVSQFTGTWTVTQDEDRLFYDCRPFGLYRTLVGYDTTADLMDNIIPSHWRKH